MGFSFSATRYFIAVFITIISIFTATILSPIQAAAQVAVDQTLVTQTVNKAQKETVKDTTTPNTAPALSTITGSCTDPIGWIVDIDKSTETTTTYNIPKDTNKKNINPKNNPNDFLSVLCSTTAKVNYKDQKTNKFQKVSNTIKEINNKQNKNTVVKPTAYETELFNQGYTIAAIENDYKAYFHTDPNKGWVYYNPGADLIKTEDDTVLEVIEVRIAGKELDVKENAKGDIKKPELKDNTITYKNIYPSIDLQYTVSETGVNKFFILKNKKALENDLSSLTYKFKTNKKPETIVEKVDVKTINPETKVEEIKKIEKQAETKIGDITIKKPITFDDLDNAAKVDTEGNKSEKINKKFDVKIEAATPTQAETNVITIYPNQDYLKAEKRKFPIVIDPEVTSLGVTQDTWVNSQSPDSPRNTGVNGQHLVVGGNAKINVTEGSGYMGVSRAYLSFRIPDSVIRESSVLSASLTVMQYDSASGIRMHIVVFVLIQKILNGILNHVGVV
jgi:hypothetical protein